MFEKNVHLSSFRSMNKDDSNTNTSHESGTPNDHPPNTGDSKPNEPTTGMNASQAASELNAIMNVKKSDIQS